MDSAGWELTARFFCNGGIRATTRWVETGGGVGAVETDRSEVALGSDPRAGRVGRSFPSFLPSFLRMDRSIDRVEECGCIGE